MFTSVMLAMNVASPKSCLVRVNLPASWSVTARLFLISCKAAIFISGKSKPSPNISTHTTIFDSLRFIFSRIELY